MISFKDTINEVIELGVSESELADVFSVSIGTIRRYQNGIVIPTVATQYVLITTLVKYLAGKLPSNEVIDFLVKK